MSIPREKRPIIVRKKVVRGHGHHGGAWKVAYADFVTAMMALFMVMWLLASTDEKSRKEIANYFRSGILEEGWLSMGHAAQVQPAVIEETGKPPPSYREAIHSEAEELRKAIDQIATLDPTIADLVDQVSVVVTEEGVLIEAIDDEGSDMLFDVSSADLKPALTQFLERLAPALADGGGTIEIEGHTDSRPFVGRGVDDNWSLSFARADAARRILERAGFPGRRITGVNGRADSRLHDPADPLAAANRRLAILVKPALGKLAVQP